MLSSIDDTERILGLFGLDALDHSFTIEPVGSAFLDSFSHILHYLLYAISSILKLLARLSL